MLYLQYDKYFKSIWLKQIKAETSVSVFFVFKIKARVGERMFFMEHIRKIYNLAYLKLHTPNNTIQITELYKDTLYAEFASCVEDSTKRLLTYSDISDEIMKKLWSVLKTAEVHEKEDDSMKGMFLEKTIDELVEFTKQYSFTAEHQFCSLFCVAVAEAIEIILYKKGENNGKMEKSA